MNMSQQKDKLQELEGLWCCLGYNLKLPADILETALLPLEQFLELVLYTACINLLHDDVHSICKHTQAMNTLAFTGNA